MREGVDVGQRVQRSLPLACSKKVAQLALLALDVDLAHDVCKGCWKFFL